MTEDELRAVEARHERARDGIWQTGIAGQCNLVAFNGEDILGIGIVNGDWNREFIAHAHQDIPRLAAALREAWSKLGEYWHRADRAEKAADEYHERMCAALHPPCPVCGNEERHSATGALTCECPDPSVTRALAAEADCKRLQDEVAALDAARREAEADLAGERGEYQRHSQGHMDRALAAEAAAAAMREALAGLLKHYMRIADSGDCGFWNPEEEPVVQAARAALKETSNG